MDETIIIKQPYVISRALYKCDELDRKILYFAALLVQREDRGKYSMYVTRFVIADMLRALGMRNLTSTRQRVKESIKHIAQNTLTLWESEEDLLVINWLQYAKMDSAKDTICLCFSEPIGRLFCECREKFSAIDPVVIGSLKSLYSMRYYEISLSFRGYTGKKGNSEKEWWFEYSIDEIRSMFRIADNAYNYKTGTAELLRNVVTQPLDELNHNNNDFKISVQKIKDPHDSRRISRLRFCCKSYGEVTRKTRTAKAIKADDYAPIERAESLYPEEFARRVEVAKIKNPIALDVIARNEAYESMKADGYDI